MGFGKMFEKQINNEAGVPKKGTESVERKGRDIRNKANEYADTVNAELEDNEFLKEKEEKYTTPFVPIEEVADTSLMEDEVELEDEADMIRYNKEHAGENGISGVKRPNLSKANFTEKAKVNYKTWTNSNGEPRLRVSSVDTEDISNQDKKAA